LGQRADGDARIDRHRVGQRGGGDAWREGDLPAVSTPVAATSAAMNKVKPYAACEPSSMSL